MHPYVSSLLCADVTLLRSVAEYVEFVCATSGEAAGVYIAY